MATTALKRGSLAIAFMFALEFVPRGFKIPDNYHTSLFAQTVLSTNQRIIDATPMRSTGLTDVTWPFKKIFGVSTILFNYAVAEPIAALAYNIEKLVRGDFKSGVYLAEENAELLKEHNITYQEELEKLEPVAQTMVRIIQFADSLTDKISNQNENQTNTNTLLENEVREILQVRQEIDLDRAYDAAEKVAKYIITTLNDPQFIKNLTSYNQRLTKILETQSLATEKLQNAEKGYKEKLDQLSQLINEYEQLGGQLEKGVKNYQQGAEERIKQIKQTMKENDNSAPVYNC